jgi:predicted ATP-grasp superfamily ATP-dependent carboligase
MPLACVIGDLSLVRALGRRRIPVALVSSESQPNASLSRYCLDVVQTPSWVDDPEGAVKAVIDWSDRQDEAPVLFYQGDHDLLAVSRARAVLEPHVRCILPDAELVETLVDKVRFAELANECELPVPTTRALTAGPFLLSQIKSWHDFPCVLKPATRSPRFRAIGNDQKAVRIIDREMLERTMATLRKDDGPFVLQAAIEGGEDQIVSYHAYVRPGGDVVAQFTGRKVRTAPRLYGYSSYIEITQDPEVDALGRQVLEALDFSGVAKVDFKRDARDGRLYLLEINPRFNLWHHPATVAGVCIPELVYRDAVDPGSAPHARVTKPGVRWVSMRDDLWAMRQYRAAGELSLGEWAAQMTTVDVNESFDLRDPVPGLVAFGKYFTQVMRRRLQGLLPAPARVAGEAPA